MTLLTEESSAPTPSPDKSLHCEKGWKDLEERCHLWIETIRKGECEDGGNHLPGLRLLTSYVISKAWSGTVLLQS